MPERVEYELTRMARWILASLACASFLGACGGKNAASSQTASAAPPAPVEEAGRLSQTRPAASTASAPISTSRIWWPSVRIAPAPMGDRRAQQYIIGQLKSFGCPVDEEDFHTPTPIGNVAMKNIVAKIPGSSPDIVCSPRITTASSSRISWARTMAALPPA